MKKKVFIPFLLCGLLISQGVSVQKANADAGLTLGIIGTALGGTALGLHVLKWLKGDNCCCGGCGSVGMAPALPVGLSGDCCAMPTYPVAPPASMPMAMNSGCPGCNVNIYTNGTPSVNYGGSGYGGGYAPQMMPQMPMQQTQPVMYAPPQAMNAYSAPAYATMPTSYNVPVNYAPAPATMPGYAYY